MAKAKSTNGSLSYDTQVLIVILLLVFAYPIGLIFMWLWMHTWPRWVKVVIALPLIISIICIFVVFYFIGNTFKQGRMYHQQNIWEAPMRKTPPSFQGSDQDWNQWENDLKDYMKDNMQDSMKKSMPQGTPNTY